MTFKEWVDTTFGAGGGGRAAEYLGLPYRTFRSYYINERFPKPTTCQIIVLKSNYKINVHKWQQAYTNKKNEVDL